MSTAFDPQSFLDATTTNADEKRPLIPAGWYTAVIGEIDPLKVKSGTIGKGERIGQPWTQIPLPIRLQLTPEAQSLGLPAEFTLTDGVFPDLTAFGGMDEGKGKNNRRRVYREATGLNKAGEPFAWRMLTGRPVRAEVIHKVLDDGRIVENVGGILPL